MRCGRGGNARGWQQPRPSIIIGLGDYTGGKLYTREFFVCVSERIPPEQEFRKHMYSMAKEMWLSILSLRYVAKKSCAFVVLCGRTEQVLRMKSTVLGDGTSVTFRLSEGRADRKRQRSSNDWAA